MGRTARQTSKAHRVVPNRHRYRENDDEVMLAAVYRAAQNLSYGALNLMVRSTSAMKIARHRGIKKVIIARCDGWPRSWTASGLNALSQTESEQDAQTSDINAAHRAISDS